VPEPPEGDHDCEHEIEEHSDQGCLVGWRYFITDDTDPGLVDFEVGCLCQGKGPRKLADEPTEDLRSRVCARGGTR
jgi:hypothetical protein